MTQSQPSTETVRGVLAVLQTPFLDDDTIDCAVLQREIDWAFEVGVDGVVVAMVSEVLRLGEAGRRELAATVAAAAQGRGTCIVSVGAESTRQATDFTEHAAEHGATAVMAIPPVATRLSDDATFDYYAAIAAASDLPLVVQDASNYVGAAINVSVYRRLLDRFGAERIYFKPEASPLGPNLSKLRDATDGAARVFEGSGGINLVDCYRRGIAGTMPGMELIDAVTELWKALEGGDEDRIYQISPLICSLVALQIQAGLDGFLAIEKYLLKKRGVFPSTRQLQPVGWVLDDETRSEVDRLFERLQAVL